jgi:putative aldouronate transport system permease protein
MKIVRTKADVAFDTFINIFLGAFTLAILYPLYYIVIASFSDPSAIFTGGITVFPKGFQLDAYQKILEDSRIWIGYRNTIFITIVGTAVNLAVTLPAAYALSRRDFHGRGIIFLLTMITMYIGGGLVPSYLLNRSLGLLDTYWVLILPGAVVVWNLIVCRTFFATSIPDELLDAASIDGCSDLRFFGSIVLPLSPALIAIMALYYGVSHWQQFFNAMIYINSPEKQTLPLVLRSILLKNTVTEMFDSVNSLGDDMMLSEVMKYGLIIVASLPLLVVYPFLQKYFIKGVLVGSVKG